MTSLNLLKLQLLDDVERNQNHVDENGNVLRKATRAEVEEGLYWPDKALTMIGHKRMDNVRYCVEQVLENNIPGDLIETGVWKGGSVIFMKGILEHYQDKTRKLFVADSFEGLPKPDVKYTADTGDSHHTISFLAVSEEQVRQNFRDYNLLDDRVIFIKGFFEDSIPNAPIDTLSILRLDGDMYSSTIQVLESLYDKLSVGGYLIIDDYGLKGCKAATDEFRTQRNITTPMIRIDHFGVFWKKE